MPRTLEDLYRVGDLLTIDDGKGEPIEIWIQKPDPVQFDVIRRDAAAAQAVVMSAEKTNDKEWQGVRSDVVLLGREAIINQLVGTESLRRRQICEMRVSFEDEWVKDGYIRGLQQAWSDGLEARLDRNPEDPEAKRVAAEIERFDEAVSEELEGELNTYRRELEAETDDFLIDELSRINLENRSLTVWNRNYMDLTIYFACRLPNDHNELMLADPDRARRLAGETKAAIWDFYQKLIVDGVEGKDSRATADSSASSAPVAPEETPDSSGLVVAAV